MAELMPVFWRAFLMVMFVSSNVAHIAQGRYDRAFVTGFLISLLWWMNARSASRTTHPYAAFTYALGAGIGTVTGIYVGNL
jgi:ABC-type antimicrobial peptide transport system permease subunit